jgi:nuclear protein localization family protein 4
MEGSGIVVRVKTSEGMLRVNVASPTTPISFIKQEARPNFFFSPFSRGLADPSAQVAKQLKVPAEAVRLSDMAKKQFPADAETVGRLGLKNGDLMLATVSVEVPRAEAEKSGKSEPQMGLPKVVEDPVDQELDKMDGWVKQQFDPKTCFRHPPNGSCVHCMPVPPWQIAELEPWKSEKIKHIPFTSWLRHRENRGECRHTKAPGIYCQNCRPLTEDSYTAKKCDRHEPWPKGVCSYCKPDAIRLTRQEYRHVDHVVIENPQVLGSLIQAWRDTGSQRCGFLFGRYEPHKDIPLGIKVVVEALYEPPQVNSPQGLQLKEDAAEEARVVAHAKALGLVMVGFAWTAIEVVQGKIVKSRDLDKTYLASGPEMLQAALFQNEHPSPCRHSMTGKYGSKWVSVIMTGTAEGELAPLVFQVSDQMAGMVRDGIITTNPDPRLLQTVDNPAVYVPKVLYDDTNEYNRAVVKEASPVFPPLPFWVDVNFAAPKQPNPLLPTNVFPVENRSWEPVTDARLTQQLRMTKSLVEVFADFHFYLHLGKILDAETLELLAAGIVHRDQAVLKEVLRRIQPLFPEVAAPAPKAAGGGAAVAKKPAGGPALPAKPNPNEAAWIAQLQSMGFAAAQSRTALEKAKWQGVEEALQFLL